VPVSELDNPVWWAMTGSQRELGTATPLATRFFPEVSPFGAFSGRPTTDHWKDLAALVGPGQTVALTGETGPIPTGWTTELELSGVQMVAHRPSDRTGGARPDRPRETPLPLGFSDVPDMLALVAAARPGPFATRTVEFGGYVGIRRRGRLVAMAGQRLRPPGFTEISAVATHPGHRHQGLAELVVRAVVEGVTERARLRSSTPPATTPGPSGSTSVWGSPSVATSRSP
jgi:FR47-like protein